VTTRSADAGKTRFHARPVGESESAPASPGAWHQIVVSALRDAEDLLDALEVQGCEHRELVILGEASFAVRWR
jgi:hypothetical protein